MYNFYLDGVQLPVTPSSLELQIKGKNQTFDLVEGGEINVIKTPGLTEVSFECDLPNVQYPYASYPRGFQNAKFYLDKIEQLKLSTKPFNFVVTRKDGRGRILFDTNLLVTIEDYKIEEDAENGTDVTVSVDMKQYRPYSTKTLNIQPATQPGAKTVEFISDRDSSNKITPKSHTVQQGETLWLIAKKYLNNGARFTELAKLNNISNPDRIRVGQVIKLG